MAPELVTFSQVVAKAQGGTRANNDETEGFGKRQTPVTRPEPVAEAYIAPGDRNLATQVPAPSPGFRTPWIWQSRPASLSNPISRALAVASTSSACRSIPKTAASRFTANWLDHRLTLVRRRLRVPFYLASPAVSSGA